MSRTQVGRIQRDVVAYLAPHRDRIKALCAVARAGHRSRLWKVCLGTAMVGFVGYGFLPDKPGIVWLFLLALGTSAVFAYHWLEDPREDGAVLVQDHIVSAVCGVIGNMSYDGHAETFDLSPFVTAHLVRVAPLETKTGRRDYSLSHHFTGSHRGSDFSLAKAQIDSASGQQRVIVFNGLLVRLSMVWHTSGRVMVLKNHGVLNYGILSLFFRDRRIEISDPKFSAQHVVRADDAAEAQAILSPEFIRSFERVKRLAPKSSLSFALNGRDLLLALDSFPAFLSASRPRRSEFDISRAVADTVSDATLVHRIIETLSEDGGPLSADAPSRRHALP